MHYPRHKDRKAHYIEQEAHEQHPHNIGTVLACANKEGSWVIGGYIHTSSTSKAN